MTKAFSFNLPFLFHFNIYNKQKRQNKYGISYICYGLGCADRLRIEHQFYVVLARCDIDGAQQIVDTSELNGVTVDCGCPAG